MKTPYFLIKEDSLEDNIKAFQKALKRYWPNSCLAYSVKTNSLPWILRYMNAHQILAEVVSDEEYQLALECGYKESDIVFNGPIKGKQHLIRALKRRAYVNADSENDLSVMSSEKFDGSRIGVRINVDTSIFQNHDIEYREDGFRFGFSEENGDFQKALRKINRSDVGLHLHCNSITRAKAVYVAIAKYAARIIEKYNLTPAFIDMGGGFFGGVPGKTTADEYIAAIRDELKNVVNIAKTKLIIEPGSAIVGSAIDLYTSVIDVKDTNRSRIITTNGSRIHIDPLWTKNKYMYSVVTTNEERYLQKQIICGYTCMDHDRMMEIIEEKELSPGDQIIYHRVGAYSVTFGGMFIKYLPEVYVRSGASVYKVRKYTSVDEYIKMHSIDEEEYT